MSLLWMKELDIQERSPNTESQSALLALGHVAIKCGLGLSHTVFGTCQ